MFLGLSHEDAVKPIPVPEWFIVVFVAIGAEAVATAAAGMAFHLIDGVVVVGRAWNRVGYLQGLFFFIYVLVMTTVKYGNE